MCIWRISRPFTCVYSVFIKHNTFIKGDQFSHLAAGTLSCYTCNFICSVSFEVFLETRQIRICSNTNQKTALRLTFTLLLLILGVLFDIRNKYMILDTNCTYSCWPYYRLLRVLNKHILYVYMKERERERDDILLLNKYQRLE